jgi:hypothetical protein
MSAAETRSNRGRGRPPRTAKRVTHSTRLRLAVREQLMAAAQASGLSASEELERRIEESFTGVSRVGRLVDSLLQAASALTGKTWENDRDTRTLAFGMVTQALAGMVEDPAAALLAAEARRGHDHWIRNAWREPDTSRGAMMTPAAGRSGAKRSRPRSPRNHQPPPESAA